MGVGGQTRPKKSKTPPASGSDGSASPTPSYKTAVSSVSTVNITPTTPTPPSIKYDPSMNSSASSIWSPASIPPTPMGDIMSNNSCMQRPPPTAGYPTTYAQTPGYTTPQNYGPSSYYGNMDYLSPMQLPVMTSNQHMTSASITTHSNNNMGSHHQMGSYGPLPGSQPIHRSSAAPSDCMDYKDNGSWPKFQVL